MPIPEAPSSGWPELAAAEKRERILAAAITVFSTRGLEAPMHEVATAAGAGVASVYRIFPSKHELWAAIVVRRMGELTAACEAAEQLPGDRWSALVSFITAHVHNQSPEPFTVEARAVVEDWPEVADAVAQAAIAEERLLAAARAEGRLRPDVTVDDLRLVFIATRAARRASAANVERMLGLMLDALQARAGG